MTRRLRQTRSEAAQDVLRSPESGKLYRVLPSTELAVPLEVWTNGSELRWRVPKPTAQLLTDARVLRGEAQDRALGKPKFRKPGQGMLEGFLRLHAATDEAIQSYASRWGALGICKHGLPHTHWPLTSWDMHAVRMENRPVAHGDGLDVSPSGIEHSALPCYTLVNMMCRIPGARNAERAARAGESRLFIEFQREFCQPMGIEEEDGRGGREQLSAWRDFSSEAELILRAAAALHKRPSGIHMSGLDADRLMFGSLAPVVTEAVVGDEKDQSFVDWRWVRSALDRWIGYGNVRPTLAIGDPQRVVMSLGSAESLVEDDLYISGQGYFFRATCGLFGALASQLLLVVQNRGGIAFCTHCQTYFDPPRKPRAGERSFCDDCRKYRSLYAAREYRARLAEAKSGVHRRTGSKRRVKER